MKFMTGPEENNDTVDMDELANSEDTDIEEDAEKGPDAISDDDDSDVEEVEGDEPDEV